MNNNAQTHSDSGEAHSPAPGVHILLNDLCIQTVGFAIIIIITQIQVSLDTKLLFSSSNDSYLLILSP